MEKQKTQRSFLQICRELFLPGKLMYIGIILYALSLIGIVDSFQDVRGQRTIAIWPFLAPTALAIFHLFPLLKRRHVKVERFFQVFLFAAFFAGVPFIFLNTISFYLASLLPMNAAMINEPDAFHYWWQDGVVQFLVSYPLIAYVIHLLTTAAVMIVIILPLYAIRKDPIALNMDEEMLEAEEPNRRRAAEKQAFVNQVIIFGLAFMIIGIILAMSTLGLRTNQLESPKELFQDFIWLIRNLQYGSLYVEEILWIIGISMMCFAVICIIYGIIYAFFTKISMMEKVSVGKMKWIMVGVVTILLIIGLSTQKNIFEGDQATLEEDLQFTTYAQMDDVYVELENTLSMFDHIKFADFSFEPGREFFYLTKRQYAFDETPAYTFSLNGMRIKDRNLFYSMHVYSEDNLYASKLEKATETRTLKNGETVYIKKEDDFLSAFTEIEDYFYEITIQLTKEDTYTIEELMEKIETMSKDTPIKQFVSETLAKQVEEQLMLPSYFPQRLPLTQTMIQKDGLKISYYDQLQASGDRSQLKAAVTLEMSEQPFYIHTKKKEEEIVLDNDRQAKLYLGYDSPTKSSNINVQNVLFFQVDDVYYQLYTANIEQPLSDKEVPQLLKMANSITRVR